MTHRKFLSTIAATTLLLATTASGCSSGKETESPNPDNGLQSAQSQPVEPDDTNDEIIEEKEEEDTVIEGSDPGDGWSEHPLEYEPQEIADPPAILTDLRVGSHDGFERVVAEFTGNGPVGWRTVWEHEVFEQGRGEPLEIEGPVFLDVFLRGTSIPMTDEDYEVYFEQHNPRISGGIRAIYDSTFEGTTHIAIGMDYQRPYRIYTLADPYRVVIDIQTTTD